MAPIAALYDIPVKKIAGTETSLREYSGKVLLVVNVASKCGLTPQYEGLERMYERYHDRGFEVLGFPANDFLGQEPGTNQEIAQFCQMKFGAKFPLFEKITVKGEGKHPLYRYLTSARPVARPASKKSLFWKAQAFVRGFFTKEGEISWNFEKFLVNRQGEVIERFAPEVTPEDPMLIGAVERAL